jgi:hypothetical protein
MKPFSHDDPIYSRRRGYERANSKECQEAVSAIHQRNRPILDAIRADCAADGGHAFGRSTERRAVCWAEVDTCWRCGHRVTISTESIWQEEPA